MPNVDISGLSPIAISFVVAAAIFGYFIRAVVLMRQDKRDSRRDELDLFDEMRSTAREQIKEMREEVNGLRERLAVAEAAATKAETQARSMEVTLALALSHMVKLEELMSTQGIQIPPRPFGLDDHINDKRFRAP